MHDAKHFADLAHAARAVADAIAVDLRSDIASVGQATLAVAGGITPAPVFEHLARMALDWDKVLVSLTDERWVETSDPRSNEGMVRRLLLVGQARSARFVGMKTGHASPVAALEMISHRLAGAGPLPRTVLLGMGIDGHVASLFRTDDMTQRGIVCATNAPDGLPRVSLTLGTLCQAARIYLLFAGERKRNNWDEIRAGAHWRPVASLLSACQSKLNVYIATQ